MTRNGSVMSLVVRYLDTHTTQEVTLTLTVVFTMVVMVTTNHVQYSDLINSKSPSGGIKLMLRSDSNLLNLTH